MNIISPSPVESSSPPARRIRVLLLSTDLQRGGLPLRLVRLACAFPALGIEPIVGCLADRGPLNEVLTANGVENFSCGGRGRFDPSCLMTLARHIRRHDPDIIHASLFHANVAARLVGRLDRPRRVITASVTVEVERPSHRFLESLTGSLSDLHVANSNAVAEHLRDELGFDASKLAVIPNAVDFDRIERAFAERRSAGPGAMPLIAWAGRMDPVKNLPALVDVIAEVRRRRPVSAVLIGDGPERPRIARLIAERGLQSVIRMAGWREDVVADLVGADVFLFPSITEGSPNVLFEAIASGCRVVASDIASCVEVMALAGTGDRCQSGDIEAMAAAVLRAVEAGRLSGSERATAVMRLRKRHDPAVVLPRWRDCYDHVLGANPTALLKRPSL